MSWFEDLTPAGSTHQRVGWLARDHAFPTGPVSAAFVARLRALAVHARANQARGYHRCELCTNGPVSSAEIWARARDGTFYVAPELIVHYVEDHHYAPPEVFVTAVLDSAHLTRRRDPDLCLTCGGHLSDQIPGRWCGTCGIYYQAPLHRPRGFDDDDSR